MPVTIIRKNKGGPSPEPDAPVVKKPPDDGRPHLTKVKKIGKEEILPDLDLHDEQGKTKFLVHYRKPGFWYRIFSYDEEAKVIKLISPHGTSFDSKMTSMVGRNYMVVSSPSGTMIPSKEVLNAVVGLLGEP